MPLTELSFLGLVATALITALLISFVATPVVKSLAQKVGAVDVPKDGRPGFPQHAGSRKSAG